MLKLYIPLWDLCFDNTVFMIWLGLGFGQHNKHNLRHPTVSLKISRSYTITHIKHSFEKCHWLGTFLISFCDVYLENLFMCRSITNIIIPL